MFFLFTSGFALEVDILGGRRAFLVFFEKKYINPRLSMNSIKLVLVLSSIKASIFWSILATRTKMLETKEIPSRKKKDTQISTVNPPTHLVHSA